MLCFIWENEGIGGVPLLFERLALAYGTKGIEIKVFAPKSSILYKNLKSQGFVNIIDLSELYGLSKSYYITKNDIIVVTYFLKILPELVKINPRILFWNVFPSTLLYVNKIHKLKLNIKYLNKLLLKTLVEKHGIVFMDDLGKINYNNMFTLNIDQEEYVPIPIQVDGTNKYLKYRLNETNKNHINITYVGRAVNWKVYPIRHVIKQAQTLSIVDKLIFTIITDDKLSFDRLLNLKNTSLAIEYFENLNENELAQFLISNSDIHFGMGTSALEGGRMGIPTVLIDFAYSELPSNYKYKWLFETKNYRLGEEVNYYGKYSGHSLEDILEILLYFDSIKNISNKCYTYVKNKHCIEEVLLKLLKYAGKTELRLKDLNKSLMSLQWWFKLYQNIKSV